MQLLVTRSWYMTGQALIGLKLWDNCSDVAESSDGESDRLKEHVDEVVVLPIHKIVTPASEQEHCKAKLKKMDPAEVETEDQKFLLQ